MNQGLWLKGAGALLTLLTAFLMSTAHAQPIALTLGVEQAGALTFGDDAEWYSVEVQANQHLFVFVSKITAWTGSMYVRYGALPTTAVYDARSYYVSGAQAAEIPLTQEGVYYIMVRGGGGSTSSYYGAYTITAKTAAEWPELVPGADATPGALIHGDDAAWYWVDVPPGRHLSVFAHKESAWTGSLYLKYGELPTETDYDWTNYYTQGSQAVDIIPATNGEPCYIMLRGGGGSTVSYYGEYTLEVDIDETWTPLTSGDGEPGALTYGDDAEWYRVETWADEHLMVFVDKETAWTGSLYLRHMGLPTASVYDARSYYVSGSQAAEIPLTQEGVYYIMVRGGGGSTSLYYGAYTLTAFITGPPRERIEGTVIAGGTPVGCAAARAVHAVTGAAYAVAVDPNGNYAIELPAGRYDVTAYSEGFESKTQRVTVVRGEVTTLHFALEPDAQEAGVSGIVTDKASALPIVGARVAAYIGGQLLAETYSCAGGYYGLRFTLPAKGGKDAVPVDVAFRAEGYRDEQFEVPVAPGAVSDQNAPLEKTAGPAILTGVVRDAATSQPIEGALVSAKTTGYAELSTVTDSGGEYLLLNLQEGTYRVEAGAMGYVTRRNRSVAVVAGGNPEADFSLDRIAVAPRLSVAPLDPWVTWKAQDLDVVIVNLGGGTISWTASIMQGGEWLGVSKVLQGVNNGVVLVRFPENTAKVKREARLAIATVEAGNQDVTLTQARGEDINLDETCNSIDVQLAINGALDIVTGWDCDIDGNGRVDSVDVQLAILAALE